MTNDEYDLHMSLNEQKLINKYADEIRRIYNIQIPITDIEEVVSKIGGIVKYDGECGYIEKNKKRGFTIHVKDCKDYHLKNFMVAKQLGKLILYTNFAANHELIDENCSISFKDSFHNSDSIFLINEFALALLMPKDEYIDEVDKNTNGNEVDTKVIAKHFDVSISSASWRGKSLGILKD